MAAISSHTDDVGLFEGQIAPLQQQLKEAHERQAATAEILQVIASSPIDTQPVFDAIVWSGVKLFGDAAVFIALPEGDRVTAAALAEADESRAAAWRARFPIPLTREYMHGWAILDGRLVDVPDVEQAPAELAAGARNFLASGYRAVTIMPMMRAGAAIGALSVVRLAPGPLSDKQLAVLKTFADQAVIAIENTRLLNELRQRTDDLAESLQQQTATAEVLQIISTSPGDLQPVFQSMLENATRICDAKFGALFLREADGFRLAALRGLPDDLAKQLRRVGVRRPAPGTVLGRVARTKQTVHFLDALAEPDQFNVPPGFTGPTLTQIAGARTLVGVPMLKEDELIGAILIYRQEVRSFTDKQIALLTNFAAQAVIAIENTRLLSELRESLTYQTATADVLKLISRSTFDLKTVLDTLTESAARLCDADMAAMTRQGDAGFQHVTNYNFPSDWVDYAKTLRLKPGRGSVVGRVLLERKAVQIADVLADPEYTYLEPQRKAGYRTFLGVPLLREGSPIGVLTLGRKSVRPFTEKQIELLTTFADQAVIAIENVRLFDELQSRTRELTRSVAELKALGEVGQAVSSSLDLTTVLGTILRHACGISQTGGGAIYVLDSAQGVLRLEAAHDMSDELIEAVRAHPSRLGDPIVGECAAQGIPVEVADIENRRDHPLFEVLRDSGVRALLAVPLIHKDKTIGVLLVRRVYAGGFAPETVKLLQTLASQSSIAINNARLFREIEEKSHQLEIASLHKSQFLANMSHELRTPLNAILGYAELIQDGVYGEVAPKIKGVLDRVQANGKHLLGLINDVLDLSKIEAGQLVLRLEDYSLSNVVQTVVTATESLAAEKKLRLTAAIAEELPVGRGDERRVAQVLLNLVGNAIKFTDKGEIKITVRNTKAKFVIKITDTGPGIPHSEHERIFEEFHQVDSSNTKKKGGTGLGLAISRRIVELHGGRISVESEPGRGSTFRVDLPIRVERQRGAS